MLMRKILALVFIMGFGASCAMAQGFSTQKIELTPFVGVKDGGKINVSQAGTNVDNLLIKSGIEYGGIFDYSLWDNFQAEVMWIRQPTYLSEHDANTGFVTRVPDGTTKLDTFTFGAAYSFKPVDAKVKPFIAGGIGWTNFTNTNNPPASGNLSLGFSNRFAYNIGGGVKYYFSRHVGARFDLRYLASRTTPGTAIQCGGFGCFQVATSNHANQLSAAAGIALRF